MSVDLVKISKDVYKVLQEHKVLAACTFTTVCGFVALRRHLAGGVCRSRVKLHGKTVLVTGANTGIGRETARDLATRGARVLLACRDVTKGERAAADIRRRSGNDNVVLYRLDLASLASVRQCATDVINKETRLDVLINNAGVMWTPQWQTEEGFELQMGTNHLGHFLFTNLLLDLLKKSGPSRIVNVSSRAHYRGQIDFDDMNLEKGYDPRTAYDRSKVANVLFTRELSKRLQGFEVSTYSLHPGVIKTELGRHMYTLNLPLWKKLLVPLAIAVVCKTTVQGAQTSIHCAVSKDLTGLSGKYFSDCAVKEEAVQAQDDETAARLWKVSEEMVGLNQKSS